MTWIALALALAAQAPPSPDATQWELVGDDDIATLSIDPARLTRTGDRVNLVLRLDMKTEESDGLRVLLSFGVVDCAARTRTVYRMEGFRMDRSLIDVHDVPADRRETNLFGDGPLDTAVFERACGRRS